MYLDRELVHFRGEMDPFKGDTLNQRVRDLAKEALEVVYLSTAAPPSMSSGSNMQVRATPWRV